MYPFCQTPTTISQLSTPHIQDTEALMTTLSRPFLQFKSPTLAAPTAINPSKNLSSPSRNSKSTLVKLFQRSISFSHGFVCNAKRNSSTPLEQIRLIITHNHDQIPAKHNLLSISQCPCRNLSCASATSSSWGSSGAPTRAGGGRSAAVWSGLRRTCALRRAGRASPRA